MSTPDAAPRRIGRYALHGAIGSGGMATVHLGRLFGPRGFARIVAIKRLHAAHADDPELAIRFLQEARLASRIRHPNVVPVLDVVAEDGELSLVMEYVEGESLARLLRTARERGHAVPVGIAAAIASDVLHGLHAAHTAESEDGQPLGVVHRDVSPQNVIVGANGVARLLDFGVAKAIGLAPATRGSSALGKLAYMAPEQLRREPVSARTDIYGASVVLWETLCGRRLFRGEDEADVVEQVLIGLVPPPSRFIPAIDDAIDAMVLRGLDGDPQRRPDALTMALALEPRAALRSVVAAWLTDLAGERMAERARLVRDVERAPTTADAAPPTVVDAALASPSRRRPLRVAALLGSVGVLVLLLALAPGRWARARRERAAADPVTNATPNPATDRALATSSTDAAALPEPPAIPIAAPPSSAATVRATPTPRPRTTAGRIGVPAATSAAPTASARRCESIDPVTGDIHFDRDCR